MTADEKLILILRKIDDVNKSTPKGKSCKLNAYRLRDDGLDFDDQQNLFELLEKDEGVIKVNEYPNFSEHREITQTEIEMAMPDNADEFTDMVENMEQPYFFFVANDKFREYFKKKFTTDLARIANLTKVNLFKMLTVAEDIHQELNINFSDEVDIEPYTSNDYLWKASYSSINHAELSDVKYKGLVFLSHLGSIKEIDTLGSPEEEIYLFRVKVDRDKFERHYKAMMTKAEPHIRQSDSLELFDSLLSSDKPKTKVRELPRLYMTKLQLSLKPSSRSLMIDSSL